MSSRGNMFITVTVNGRKRNELMGWYNDQLYAFAPWGDAYVARDGNDWLTFLWSTTQDDELSAGREVSVEAVRLTPEQREAYQISEARELVDFLFGFL